MLNKTKDEHKDNGAVSSGSQTKSLEKDPKEKRRQDHEADAEIGESNVVVNEEDQNRVTKKHWIEVHLKFLNIALSVCE